MSEHIEALILVAGVGQLVLAAASTCIPKQLEWTKKLSTVDPLLRRVFWVYAGYILGTNVSLGLVSLLAADALAEPGSLAFCLNGYAALYWGARLAIQFLWFRKLAPNGLRFRLAEVALVVLFMFLTATYLLAAWNAGSAVSV